MKLFKKKRPQPLSELSDGELHDLHTKTLSVQLDIQQELIKRDIEARGINTENMVDKFYKTDDGFFYVSKSSGGADGLVLGVFITNDYDIYYQSFYLWECEDWEEVTEGVFLNELLSHFETVLKVVGATWALLDYSNLTEKNEND